ncbi:MAG: hypothetical protein WCF26_22785 [Candidatus Sulfotelmatobacter sp.]
MPEPDLPQINPQLQKWMPESQIEKEPGPHSSSPERMTRKNWVDFVGELVVGVPAVVLYLLGLLFLVYSLWRAMLHVLLK